jgi:hypothetical protein
VTESPAHADTPIDPHPRTEKWALGNALIATAAVIVAVSALIYGHHADSNASQAHRDVRSLQGGFASANTKLTEHGIAPVPTPSAASPVPTVTITRQGATGAVGPAPSGAQIELAVTQYCAVHTCGTPPSAAVVAQAIASYCNSNGKCRGPVGANATGSPGVNGRDGSNVTADQVAAGVATYCGSHSQCQGAPGPAGPSGPPGASGENGQPVQSFTFTFVVPGNGLTVSDTTYRTTCTYPEYQCDTVKQG